MTNVKNYEEMTPSICRQWLDLCTRRASETLQIEGQAPKTSFMPREDEFFKNPVSVACLGLLLQWSCEQPDDFSRTFEAVLPEDAWRCTFHHLGLEGVVNLVRNGIMDDWEIFAQWTPHGYMIVPDGQQTDADRRFNFKWAPEWLWGRVGGAHAPSSEYPELHARAIELSVKNTVPAHNLSVKP